MKINWKLRLQNKFTLSALISALVVFVYEVAGTLGFVPPVSQEQVLSGVAALITVLVALGIVVDPTTGGASDSDRALGYEEPAPNVKEDTVENELANMVSDEATDLDIPDQTPEADTEGER